jgi:nitrous oxidase accessory protein NosD
MIKFRHGCRMGTLLGGGLLLGSLMMAQWSAAATYYVAPNGNNANRGTIDQPFQRLLVGVSVLAPGDTLYIRGGTYDESLVNVVPGGTSWDAATTVAAYQGESVTLTPSSDPALDFGSPAAQYIIVDGLILDAVHGGVEAAIIWNGAHHVRLINCELKNSPTNGLLVEAPDNEFINLKVHDNGSNGLAHGLYITRSNNLVEGSEVYHNTGWGVHIYTGTGSGADNNIVRGNEIYENARAGAGGDGVILSSGTGNIAEGNRIWGNHVGIAIDSGSKGAQVSHNEVYDNELYGIYIGPGSDGAVVHDNDVYDNPGGNIYDYRAGSSVSQ